MNHPIQPPAVLTGLPPKSPGIPGYAWRQEVDRSTRLPVLTFAASAIAWLLIGSAFALLAAFKLDFPDWLAGQAALTFGRVRPAHLHATIYGWISMAGVGIMVWLWARLLKTPLRGQWLVLTAAVLWNTGLLVGVTAILAGGSTGVEWLEMPLTAFLFIVAALLLVAIAMVWTLIHHRVEHFYISVWYLGAGMLWMPFLLLVVLLAPQKGLAQATANWWFAHNVVGLWLTPVGLATAYYLIPRITGKPIYSYNLAYLGFWTLALFFGWTGVHHLAGGPVPQWLEAVSIAFSFMMIIPVVAVAVNFHKTMTGSFNRLKDSVALRFVVFGAVSYTVVGLIGAVQSFRVYQEVVHFTQHTVAHAHLGVYAFASMIAFGALYHVVPRLTGRDWESSRLVNLHFWVAAGGITIQWAALTIAGFTQGLQLLDPVIPFVEIARSLKPWLLVRSITGVFLTAGHFVFAWLLYRNVRPSSAVRTRMNSTAAQEAGFDVSATIAQRSA